MAHQTQTDVFYPETDGEPMGETEWHYRLLKDLVDALAGWLAGRADAHVAGNVFVYYTEGTPSDLVCPDVFVAFGSHKGELDTYLTWLDGPFPQVVIELASPSTRAQDKGPKRTLYERLGVLEYYIFDPRVAARGRATGRPPAELRRYVRAAADVPFGAVQAVAEGAVVHSELLGLGLTTRGRDLRLQDEATGRLLPTRADLEIALRAAEAQAQAEAQAREDEARARAAADAQAAAAEERARALAEELARLRAHLDRRPDE